jgi:formylglycine-generating enzyme
MKNGMCLAVFACLLTAGMASAEVVRGINMDFVTIGHAGNSNDIYGYGAVADSYRIGKYEVTNAQWTAFTTAAGKPAGNEIPGGGQPYDQQSSFTGSQQPVQCVSWYEAAQFCNYLTTGDKSKGVYRWSGTDSNPGNYLGTDRALAQETYGTIYFLPTMNEWYKAAYYKPDGSGYSLYANGTGIAPTSSESCYNRAAPWNVGTGAIEQNGTFDMMGNVHEWNETVTGYLAWGVQGGQYYDTNTAFLAASSNKRNGTSGSGEYVDLGFRVASVPEPGTMVLLAVGGLVARRVRNVRKV